MQHKRKTISGNDVVEAMKEMDFERFVEPLQEALEGIVVRLQFLAHTKLILLCADKDFSQR